MFPKVLRSNQFFKKGRYKLALGGDGRLGIYRDAGDDNEYCTWQAGVLGGAGSYLLMQEDGNLVLYTATGNAIWATGTMGILAGGDINISASGALQILNKKGVVGWESAIDDYYGNGILRLVYDEELKAGLSITRGRYTLALGGDGRLAIYRDVGTDKEYCTWQAGVLGGARSYLRMQADGNLVLYTATGNAIWATGTMGLMADASAIISVSGTLQIVNKKGVVGWESAIDDYYGNGILRLVYGEELKAGLSITRGRYTLALGGDGRLAIYRDVGTDKEYCTWQAGVLGGARSYLRMQADGNLVLYTAAGNSIWASGTMGAGSKGYALISSDGNLLIANGFDKFIWSTNQVAWSNLQVALKTSNDLTSSILSSMSASQIIHIGLKVISELSEEQLLTKVRLSNSTVISEFQRAQIQELTEDQIYHAGGELSKEQVQWLSTERISELDIRALRVLAPNLLPEQLAKLKHEQMEMDGVSTTGYFASWQLTKLGVDLVEDFSREELLSRTSDNKSLMRSLGKEGVQALTDYQIYHAGGELSKEQVQWLSAEQISELDIRALRVLAPNLLPEQLAKLKHEQMEMDGVSTTGYFASWQLTKLGVDLVEDFSREELLSRTSDNKSLMRSLSKEGVQALTDYQIYHSGGELSKEQVQRLSAERISELDIRALRVLAPNLLPEQLAKLKHEQMEMDGVSTTGYFASWQLTKLGVDLVEDFSREELLSRTSDNKSLMRSLGKEGVQALTDYQIYHAGGELSKEQVQWLSAEQISELDIRALRVLAPNLLPEQLAKLKHEQMEMDGVSTTGYFASWQLTKLGVDLVEDFSREELLSRTSDNKSLMRSLSKEGVQALTDYQIYHSGGELSKEQVQRLSAERISELDIRALRVLAPNLLPEQLAKLKHEQMEMDGVYTTGYFASWQLTKLGVDLVEDFSREELLSRTSDNKSLMRSLGKEGVQALTDYQIYHAGGELSKEQVQWLSAEQISELDIRALRVLAPNLLPEQLAKLKHEQMEMDGVSTTGYFASWQLTKLGVDLVEDFSREELLSRTSDNKSLMRSLGKEGVQALTDYQIYHAGGELSKEQVQWLSAEQISELDIRALRVLAPNLLPEQLAKLKHEQMEMDGVSTTGYFASWQLTKLGVDLVEDFSREELLSRTSDNKSLMRSLGKEGVQALTDYQIYHAGGELSKEQVQWLSAEQISELDIRALRVLAPNLLPEQLAKLKHEQMEMDGVSTTGYFASWQLTKLGVDLVEDFSREELLSRTSDNKSLMRSLSKEGVQALTDYQIYHAGGELTPTQVSWLTYNQLDRIMRPSAGVYKYIGALGVLAPYITKTQIYEMKYLNVKQVNLFTAEQFQYFSYEDVIKHFSVSDFSMLTKDGKSLVSTLDQNTIGILDITKLNDLLSLMSDEQKSWVSLSQLRDISGRSRMTEATRRIVAQFMSDSTLSMLTGNDLFPTWREDRGSSPPLVNFLTNYQVSKLSSKVVESASKNDFLQLTKDGDYLIKHLSANVFASLSSDIWLEFSLEEISNIGLKSISQFHKDIFFTNVKLDDEREIFLIEALTETQLKSISYASLYAILSSGVFNGRDRLIKSLSADNLTYVDKNGRTLFSFLSSSEIVNNIDYNILMNLSTEMLNRFDSNKKPIASTVLEILTDKQISNLSDSAISASKNLALRKNILDEREVGYNNITQDNADQVNIDQNNPVNQDPKSPKIIAAIKLPKLIKMTGGNVSVISAPKWSTSLYGGNIADTFSKVFLFSPYVNTSAAWALGVTNSIEKYSFQVGISFGGLELALARYKTTGSSEALRDAATAGIAIQLASLIAAAYKFETNAATDSFADRFSTVLSAAGNAASGAYSILGAKDAVNNNERRAGLYMFGVAAEARAAVALLKTIFGFGNVPFGAVGATVNVAGFVGAVLILKSATAAVTAEERAGFAFQILNMAGGFVTGTAVVNSVIVNSRIAEAKNLIDSTYKIIEGPGYVVAEKLNVQEVLELLQKNGISVPAEAQSAQTLAELDQIFKSAGVAAARAIQVVAGITMLVAAANPIPYMSGKAKQDYANVLRTYAESQSKSGSDYKGDFLLADFLDKLGKDEIVFAGIGSALMAAAGVSMIAGLSSSFTSFLMAARLIVDMVAQGAYDKLRLDLASDIKLEGGLDSLYDQNLSSQNKQYMRSFLSNDYDHLSSRGLSSLAIIGGQSLSKTAVELGLYAVNKDNLLPLFAQNNFDTTKNFANLIASEDVKSYTTVVDFISDIYSDSGDVKQDVNLYKFISEKKGTEDNPVYSGIEFYNPILLPKTVEGSSWTTTTRGKNTNIIQYLSDKFIGGVFNLAHKSLSRGSFVTVDLSNLLVNYISSDVDGENSKVITIENEMRLGNAQYYIYGSLSNFYITNDEKYSNEGFATLDYSKLGDTGYSAKLRMSLGKKYVTVNKELKKSSNSFYYQEATNSASVQVGKKTASAKYLTIKSVTGQDLDGQRDIVDGQSNVRTVIATGRGNVLTGYNEWILQGGSGAYYVFNDRSNNFRKSSSESLAAICIMQGVITTNSNGDITSTNTEVNTVALEGLLNIKNVYFYLSTNLRDLSIVNAESNQRYVIYDFMNNAAYNTIKLNVASSGYTINGENLKRQFIREIGLGTLSFGHTINASDVKEITFNATGVKNVDTEIVTGHLYADNAFYRDGSNSYHRAADYSKMDGAIEVCLLDNDDITVYKYQEGSNTIASHDFIADCNQVYGTVYSDTYLDIDSKLRVEDSSGANSFFVKKGGELELSGLCGAKNDQLTTLVNIAVNNLNSLYFYLDELTNLNIRSMDDSNIFSVKVIKYGYEKEGSAYLNNIAIGLSSAVDGHSFGYLNTSSINKLINDMAQYNGSGFGVSSSTWVGHKITPIIL